MHECDGIGVNQYMILQGCVDDVKTKWEFHLITVSHLRQATVLIVVPPIAVDITQLAQPRDRVAFASVHTIISGAAPLSPDFLRKLKRLTGIRRVQTCEQRVLQICCETYGGYILCAKFVDSGYLNIQITDTKIFRRIVGFPYEPAVRVAC